MDTKAKFWIPWDQANKVNTAVLYPEGQWSNVVKSINLIFQMLRDGTCHEEEELFAPESKPHWTDSDKEWYKALWKTYMSLQKTYLDGYNRTKKRKYKTPASGISYEEEINAKTLKSALLKHGKKDVLEEFDAKDRLRKDYDGEDINGEDDLSDGERSCWEGIKDRDQDVRQLVADQYNCQPFSFNDKIFKKFAPTYKLSSPTDIRF